MKHSVLLLFLMLVCCNNSTKSNKNYADYHSAALKYCKEKGFNDRYYFLLDFNVHSGKNRFFIYDFKKGEIIGQNLVTHGSCDVFEANPAKYTTAKFDVKTDSHCSMKGKYKIGRRDSSSWGIKIKYWLEGLETSNKSAVERVVVLHSWEAVADKEIFPDYSPLSWGCPAVSDAFMKKLDVKLKDSDKPVLLWIIE